VNIAINHITEVPHARNMKIGVLKTLKIKLV